MTHISIMEGNTMGFVIESGVLKKYIEEPKVTVVEIPEGVTSIDEDAFADCETVSSVAFPSTSGMNVPLDSAVLWSIWSSSKSFLWMRGILISQALRVFCIIRI